MNNRRIIYAAVFLRALATGMIGVLAGIYFSKLGLREERTGLLLTTGLAGAAAATILATLAADKLGQRRFLIVTSLCSSAGGIGLALLNHPLLLLPVAFFGMVNGMGRDRGASLVIEQAILPSTTTDADRTRVFAWYNIFQDAGRALGGLMAGLPAVLSLAGGLDERTAYRITFAVYALLMLIPIPFYLRLRLTPSPQQSRPRITLTPESRKVLTRICMLFAVDSIAGGFLTTALLSYFFYIRFGVSEAAVGTLFFAAAILNAFSHLGAAWLAKRIGLVNTMVFTHIPGSLLLITVPFAPTFSIAALLYLLREGLVEMDVPTRQSYVMAVVRPEERTFASGITHIVRMVGWTIGPTLAGWLTIMTVWAQAAPLFVGAGMKIGYDLLLYRSFRRLKPPEEQ